MPKRRIIDLFAGAGGWDEGLAQLGHHALGIDTDELACRTAEAAGHERLIADIPALDPKEFGPVWGVIASPPCQAYSTAGRKLGRRDKPEVIACAHELAAGHDTRQHHRTRCHDSRSLLTVEPLRWILALRPRWVALEQVPPVLELWSEFAGLLAVHGYASAVGVLSAEQYGVPQTRRRAFLIASLDGPVALPAPSHRAYSPRSPELTRPGEEGLLPWVSMAQALGWTGRAMTFTNCQTDSGRRPRGLSRPTDRPARTVDSSCGAWTIEPVVDDPPPLGMDTCQGWSRVRPVRCPAPTLTAYGLGSKTVWTTRRSATTTTTDSQGPPHRHQHNRPGPSDHSPGQRARSGVRVTMKQAGTLQGFRPDYPWKGTKSRQFLQIGNAVCPPVAKVVLAEAMAPTLTPDRTAGRP